MLFSRIGRQAMAIGCAGACLALGGTAVAEETQIVVDGSTTAGPIAKAFSLLELEHMIDLWSDLIDLLVKIWNALTGQG